MTSVVSALGVAGLVVGFGIALVVVFGRWR